MQCVLLWCPWCHGAPSWPGQGFAPLTIRQRGKRGEEAMDVSQLWQCWRAGWKQKNLWWSLNIQNSFHVQGTPFLSRDQREAGKLSFKIRQVKFSIFSLLGGVYLDLPQSLTGSSASPPFRSLRQLFAAFHASETLRILFSAVSPPSCHPFSRCTEVVSATESSDLVLWLHLSV